MKKVFSALLMLTGFLMQAQNAISILDKKCVAPMRLAKMEVIPIEIPLILALQEKKDGINPSVLDVSNDQSLEDSRKYLSNSAVELQPSILQYNNSLARLEIK